MERLLKAARIAVRKALRFFGWGERLYIDPWCETEVARLASADGVQVIEVRLTTAVYRSLRDQFVAINATRARFGLGPLFRSEWGLRGL